MKVEKEQSEVLKALAVERERNHQERENSKHLRQTIKELEQQLKHVQSRMQVMRCTASRHDFDISILLCMYCLRTGIQIMITIH